MSKVSQYTIHLVRVGETAWDADDRIIGDTDLPMTDAGTAAVATALRSFHDQSLISILLTSHEEAAQQAVKLVGSSTDIKIKAFDSLNNVGQGLWEGVLKSDLENRYPSAYSQWQETPERIVPPEGESFEVALDRLISTIAKATTKAKGPNPVFLLVLRPWAWVTVRCWLNDQKISDIWNQLAQPIQVESYQVTKSSLEAFQKKLRASA